MTILPYDPNTAEGHRGLAVRRRALIVGVAAAVAAPLIAPSRVLGATMTSPTTSDVAELVTGGAYYGGYANTSPSPQYWEAMVERFCARRVEERAMLVALAARDRDKATRGLLRCLAGTATATVRILCVGDSITMGVGSQDGTGYRGWLADRLDQRNIIAAMSTCAISGVTLRELAPYVPAALAANTPDIVLVNIGTGDATRPDMTDWQARYASLVDQILASSPTVRVACARPSYGDSATVAANEQTIGGYVATVVAARQSTGRIVAVDLTSIHKSWTVDGVHPTDAGYLRMAQIWDAAITPWLPAVPSS